MIYIVLLIRGRADGLKVPGCSLLCGIPQSYAYLASKMRVITKSKDDPGTFKVFGVSTEMFQDKFDKGDTDQLYEGEVLFYNR